MLSRGGVCRDPQIVLRNIWTAPNKISSQNETSIRYDIEP